MNFWQNLSQRDQKALMLAAAALSLYVLWAFAWQPLIKQRLMLQKRVDSQQSSIVWMQQAQVDIQKLSQNKNHSFKPRAGQSLLTILDQTARLQGLGERIRRGEPAGEGRVRLWLDQANFDLVMLWIERVERDYGIIVDEISSDQADLPGQVNVRIRFHDLQNNAS